MILDLQREFLYDVERIDYTVESSLSAPFERFAYFIIDHKERYDNFSEFEYLTAQALRVRYSRKGLACSKDFSDTIKELSAEALKKILILQS